MASAAGTEFAQFASKRFQMTVHCDATAATLRRGTSMLAHSEEECSLDFDAIEGRLGLSRRDFLKFCTGLASTMGLPAGADAAIAKAVESARRPSVIWLHFQECTGCTESLLRANHPTLERLILDIISLDYHETLFAAAGHQAEAARRKAMADNKGKYLLVVEGAIPTKD